MLLTMNPPSLSAAYLLNYQGAFHVFGMELLASFDLKSTTSFFDTFFRLPSFYWRGFLASKLTPTDLVGFALFTFLIAGMSRNECEASGHHVMGIASLGKGRADCGSLSNVEH
jgi:hypothetical protein